MCGIVGIVSSETVLRSAVAALGRLEYRGYDSYGFAYRTPNGISTTKAVGAIGDAIADGLLNEVESSQVLCHTRWATHGGVTERNAHPHTSFDGRVSIVHNGVIENYKALRRRLQNAGIKCISETDSEVVAHLIAQKLQIGEPMLNAIAGTLGDLVGEYALGVIDAEDAETVYGVRYRSPLLAGSNGQFTVLGSDPLAFDGIEAITHLEDGDIVKATKTGIEIYQQSRAGGVTKTERPSVPHEFQRTSVSKGEYPHFMLKEMHECPQAIKTITSLTKSQFQGIFPKSPGKVSLVGAGSAYYVGIIGQYLFAELAREGISVLPSDEAPNLLCLSPGDRIIAVSQSGETYDTLEAVRAAQNMGAELISVTNVPGSSLERAATRRIQQGSGMEVCVLSTKSVLSQVAILMRIALERGLENRALSPVRYENYSKALQLLPDRLEDLITKKTEQIKNIASEISRVSDWFFIGKGLLYPAALESALKFKEVSYHHAEGMAAGFLKHGTISLIQPEFYTISLLPSRATDDTSYHATLSSVHEIAARGGPVIGIGPSNAEPDDIAAFKYYVDLDYLDDGITDVFLQLFAGQMLAYYCAVSLGRNIDRPRGLAKSVTVR
ncbi:glutamine--fructose-6-phosphate transaminase (isomerizing) [Rhizobium leguminosarum]|uniref:glutamine--fructose-6-phosphate transaminase (isomerizing) n=1 Tax=Rhizobium leguminosarum TaxID=384 RepID=UPI003F9BAFAE